MLIPQKCNIHSILIVTFYYFTIYFKKCCYSCLNCSIRPGNKRTLRIRTQEHQAIITTCIEPLLPKGCSFLNKRMCGNAKENTSLLKQNSKLCFNGYWKEVGCFFPTHLVLAASRIMHLKQCMPWKLIFSFVRVTWRRAQTSENCLSQHPQYPSLQKVTMFKILVGESFYNNFSLVTLDAFNFL